MAKNTIKVKKYSDVIEEMTSVGVITPGMLVEIDSAGEVQAHSSGGGDVIPMYALEDELQGKSIDDDFAADDKVQVWIPYRGDIIYALVADGEDIAIGDYLTSNGDGTLKEDTGSDTLVAQAIEAVTPSGADGRCQVRSL